MPGTTISSFSDPEDYTKVLWKDGGFVHLVTGPGQFLARVARISLPGASLVESREELARVAFVAVPPALTRISLPPRGAPMTTGGVSSVGGEIVTHGPNLRFHERTDGMVRWRALWFQHAELVKRGKVVVGQGFALPAGVCRWHPAASALRQLARLCDDALRATEHWPDLIARDMTARGLEQQLIEAVVECLSRPVTDRDIPARCRQSRVLGAFEDALGPAPDGALRVAEIARSLGVSSQTLRAYCQAHLGMGPQRYLHLRRLHAVRRALRDPQASSGVSEVLRRHGFGDPGRFAAGYREHFGELPSATLQHRPVV